MTLMEQVILEEESAAADPWGDPDLSYDSSENCRFCNGEPSFETLRIPEFQPKPPPVPRSSNSD